MSPELIGILSVGVALAALHMASIKSLRDELRGEFRGELKNIRDELKNIRDGMKDMESRMTRLEQRMGSLEQRMAHLEGVLEGFREALFERSRRTAE